MLHTLHLQNFALIDDDEITLHAGFNVITGETGAGKSLMLDALSLATGGRGRADMVRFGEKHAEIYAHFDSQDKDVQAWFDENERDFCEGDIVIRRQISSDGRSKGWINGVPASLSELKSLGTKLVNIHSQHAGLELLKPNFALKWLDVVGGLDTQAVAVKDAYHTWQSLIDEQKNASLVQAGRLDRINLLKTKLDDLEPLMDVDMKAVESSYEELSNIESLINDAYQISNILNSDSDEPSVIALLGKALKLCESNSHLSESFAQAYSSLSDSYELIKDVSMSLADYGENQSTDPEELERLNTLMGHAYRLASKYRMPIDELLGEAKDYQQELEYLESLPDAGSLDAEIAKAYDRYHALASELQQAREQIAPTLCQTLQTKLAPLALPNASCQFVFDERKMPSSHGLFDIDLLFSANVGMPLLPLHKVASGGELSRMALIMQVMRASNQVGLPLLVFDEVDVGISGGTAQVVGELLRSLGVHQQLIAITHQAQVACCGHAHILVKKEHGEMTTSGFTRLEGDSRIYELARMSGGVNITDETLAHAKSLLDAVL